MIGHRESRDSASMLFDCLTPIVQRALVRTCLWKAAHNEGAIGWSIGAPRVMVRRGRKSRWLHEFDLEEMWSIVLSHSEYTRALDTVARTARR